MSEPASSAAASSVRCISSKPIAGSSSRAEADRSASRSPSSPIPANRSSPSSSPKSKSMSSSLSSEKSSSPSLLSVTESSNNASSLISLESPNRSSSNLRSSSSISIGSSPRVIGFSVTIGCSRIWVSSSFLPERRLSSITTSNAIKTPGISASPATNQVLESKRSIVEGAKRAASSRLRFSSCSSFSTSLRIRFSSPNCCFKPVTSFCTSLSIKRRR